MQAHPLPVQRVLHRGRVDARLRVRRGREARVSAGKGCDRAAPFYPSWSPQAAAHPRRPAPGGTPAARAAGAAAPTRCVGAKGRTGDAISRRVPSAPARARRGRARHAGAPGVEPDGSQSADHQRHDVRHGCAGDATTRRRRRFADAAVQLAARRVHGSGSVARVLRPQAGLTGPSVRCPLPGTVPRFRPSEAVLPGTHARISVRSFIQKLCPPLLSRLRRRLSAAPIITRRALRLRSLLGRGTARAQRRA